MAEPAPQSIQTERSQEQTMSNAYLWLTRGIAVLLLFAAGMKAWQLATVPSLGEGLLHARWFNIVVVEFEIVFACWLLMGLLPKLTRWATITLFTTFAGVSLYKALSGEASCGCFGAVTVNPWWTMGLDVVVVCSLLLLKSSDLIESRVFLVNSRLSEVVWFQQTGILTAVITVFMLFQDMILVDSIISIEQMLSAREVTFSIDQEEFPEKKNTVFMRASNRTNQPITIVNAKTGCRCIRW